jgi:hypothetical protein
MSTISGMRLHMLPLHRLASGLRKVNSLFRPEKYSFIHFDGQVDEEEQPDINKCVSNLLDGVPLRWEQDEVICGHLESIVSSYGRSKSDSRDLSSPLSVLLGREDSTPQKRERVESELSFGSDKHAAGMCKPCAWNRKPGGCFKGSTCEFCHTCDDGAVKRKKTARAARVKERRRAAKLTAGRGEELMPSTPRSDWD